MSHLPPKWRSLPYRELEHMIESCDVGTLNLTDDDIEDLCAELDERDAQADANRGVINGLPPER